MPGGPDIDGGFGVVFGVEFEGGEGGLVELCGGLWVDFAGALCCELIGDFGGNGEEFDVGFVVVFGE